MNWNFAHGTLIGPYHTSSHLPNQDSYGFMKCANNKIIVCVADGAGSLKKSDIGSSIAVETAISSCKDNTSDNFSTMISQALDESRNELLSHEDSSEMGCTIALGVADETHWGVGVVGDAFGVVHYDDENKSNFFVSEDQDTEYANVTHLLTSKVFNPKIVEGDEIIRGLSLSSDGLDAVGVKQKEAVDKFWNPLIERTKKNNLNVDEFFSYLESQNMIVDDTTLVMAIKQ